MGTGKQTRWSLAVLCALLLLSIACQSQGTSPVRQDTPATAWWHDIRFKPTSESVNGMNVHKINPDWQHADALGLHHLTGRVSEDDIRTFKASPISFSRMADLNGNSTLEHFFVGVYQTTDGGEGRFVAITEDGQLLQHFTEEGTAGFSALLQNTDEMHWYKCMECGEFESIKWAGESYVLE